MPTRSPSPRGPLNLHGRRAGTTDTTPALNPAHLTAVWTGLNAPLTDLIAALTGTEPCTTSDNPDRWFEDLSGYRDHTQQQKAAALCAGCPITADCAAWATRNNITHGVWGGMTTRTRHRIHRRPLRQTA